MVHSRFVCHHKGEPIKGIDGNPDGRQIRLDVALDDPSFKVATPAGCIHMVITTTAADQFEPGATYKVTFEKEEVAS